MKKHWNTFFALVCFGLLLSACDTSSNTQGQPSLKMNAQAAQSSEVVVASGDTVLFRPLQPGEGPCRRPETCDLPPIGVTNAQGQLRITDGYFLAPYGDARLQGQIEKNGDQIMIRVQLDRDHGDDTHPMELKPFLYDARVADLEPGMYQLHVVHEHDALRAIQGTSGPDSRAVVVDQQVTVQ